MNEKIFYMTKNFIDSIFLNVNKSFSSIISVFENTKIFFVRNFDQYANSFKKIFIFYESNKSKFNF